MTCKHLLQGAPECVFCHRDQLKKELRLAEEGLANAMQEIERLKAVIDSRDKALGFEPIPDVQQSAEHPTAEPPK